MITPTVERSAALRWKILLAISHACPSSAHDAWLLDILGVDYADLDVDELRDELEYLANTGLIVLDRPSKVLWLCSMRTLGLRYVYYATSDMPDIARPKQPRD